MEKSISHQIAEFSVNLKFEDLQKKVVETTKKFIYDSIGCAFGGYHTKDVNILKDIYVNMGGKEEATLIGFGKKIPAVNATLVN
ncbi:MAG: MmgE/PrpD family protein, partial [Ignavibacteriales bacterium CG_4_9_14_3_um_filter_30_11]